ncbi:hypothetical protein RB200_20605 [Streptomyces sp. PmtG]
MASLVQAGRVCLAASVERCPPCLLRLFGKDGQQRAARRLVVAGLTEQRLGALVFGGVHAVGVATTEHIVEATQPGGSVP